MTEDHSQNKPSDWAGNAHSFGRVWGIPIIALVWVPHPAKTLLWTAALGWMGVACLMNARRCGRTHCFYTGPFFLIMAFVGLLHGFQIVPLGAGGWTWIGIATGIGTGGLWCLTEKILGKYRHQEEAP
jgi:hypothetical protein